MGHRGVWEWDACGEVSWMERAGAGWSGLDGILPKSLAIIFMMESSSNTSRVGFEYGFDMFAVRFEGAGTISTTSLGARLFPLSSTASVPAVEPTIVARLSSQITLTAAWSVRRCCSCILRAATDGVLMCATSSVMNPSVLNGYPSSSPYPHLRGESGSGGGQLVVAVGGGARDKRPAGWTEWWRAVVVDTLHDPVQATS